MADNDNNEQLTRATFYLHQEDRDILEELAALSGQSMGSLVRQMLKESRPGLRQALDAFRLASEKDKQAYHQLSQMLGEQVGRLTKTNTEIVKTLTEKKEKE